jgi:hypothetical protein
MSWTRIVSDEEAAAVVEEAVEDALDALTRFLDEDEDLDLPGATRARLLDQATRQLRARFADKLATWRRGPVH